MLNPLHLALDTLLEFFMLAARHRLLLPMCSRQLGHHLGWLLPRLPRSWVCRAPLLGSDTTVTILRHTQLYGNTFHRLYSYSCCFTISCSLQPRTPPTTTIAAGPNSDFKPAKHDCRCRSGTSTSSTADQAPPQIRICCISPLHE